MDNKELIKELKVTKKNVQRVFELFRAAATEAHDCRTARPFIAECKRANKTLCELINHVPAERIEKPFEDPHQYKIFEEDKQ